MLQAMSALQELCAQLVHLVPTQRLALQQPAVQHAQHVLLEISASVLDQRLNVLLDTGKMELDNQPAS